jgi:phage terminase small subunit
MATTRISKKPPVAAPKAAPVTPKPKQKPAKTRQVKPVRDPKAVSPKGKTRLLIDKSGLSMSAEMLRERFAAEFVIDLDASKAYQRVCPNVTAGAASVSACRLLAEAKVNALISEKAKAIADKLEESGVKALKQMHLAAYGDARKLSEPRVGACRYCHGIDFGFQRTTAERKSAHIEYLEKCAVIAATEGVPMPPFDEMGGVGFHAGKPPHPDCPHCAGEGVARVAIKDGRSFDAEALAIYAGAEVTKTGIKVSGVDRLKPLDMIARHENLYKADNSIEITADSIPPELLEGLAQIRGKKKAEREAEFEERRRLGFTGD